MFYIFDKKGEFIATSDFEPNLEDLATRDEHCCESGEKFINPFFTKGNIIERGNAPSSLHNWNGKNWEISPEKLTTLLTERKNAVLLRLAAKADELKTGLLAGYPQTEIESFYRQEKEALAWQADHNTPTPMLSQIARVRGVPLEVLIRKVIEKSAQFAVAIGIIIGQRQAFEDRLMAVQTLEELEPLSQEIAQWQFQVN